MNFASPDHLAMSAHTFFAPAKLNLFLHVNGRRADGYHLLQSLFVLLDYGDTITIHVRDDGKICRTNDVPNVSAETDLAIRSAFALKSASNCKLGADITVSKLTPMGAGLGGGSSDAATVLMALNKLWQCNFSSDELRAIGLTLGADVPFFVFGQSAFVEGVGEVLTPAAVPAWWYVVATPDVHVPTPFVFNHSDLTRASLPVKIADFSAAILSNYKNDLQAVVLNAFSQVAVSFQALSAVSNQSLFGARMTGSGAGHFAAFATEHEARTALNAFQQLSPKNTGFIAKGLVKHPVHLQLNMQDDVASG
jgi:4-diphosphocytidyl-2-C-methyl-D-erythritol kinase